MRIVYCIPSVFNSGGMERILSVKANYLVEKGFEVYVVTTDQKDKGMFFSFSPNIQFVDIDINYSDNQGGYSPAWFVKRIIKGRLHRKRLKKVLSDIRPDITISMFQHESSFLYKQKDGSVKLIESHFCMYVRQFSSKSLLGKIITSYRTNQDSRLVKKYDRFITLTKEDRSYWPMYDTIKVIPNPLTIASETLSPLNQKQIIAVGRISYQKGFDRLIEAWNIVNQQRTDWSLRIIGSDASDVYTNEVKNLIAKYELDNVTLVKATFSIEKEYQNSSFLVMSSRYEGFGLVLIEAMSYGLPCVSFDCKCGPKDIIAHGVDGFLVEEGNIRQLANSMLELMNNPDKLSQMAQKAKEKSNQYTVDQIMQKWIDLFQECVNKSAI